jgi:hypothetical protein
VWRGRPWPHPNCCARADREKLRQILLNLLTNAIEFTAAGGHVTLACETDAGGGVTHVRVTDTGRGIPADQLDRIFEPFVQVDRHRTHESRSGGRARPGDQPRPGARATSHCARMPWISEPRAVASHRRTSSGCSDPAIANRC